jgi:hypothetical protein
LIPNRGNQLRCYDTLDEALADFAPFQFPVTREEERVWIRSDRAIARACAEHGGPILNHMSTANADADRLSDRRRCPSRGVG